MKKKVSKKLIAIIAAMVVASSISTTAFAATTSLTQESTMTNLGDSNTTYTIMAGAASNGTISPAGTVSGKAGENKTFSITPNSGYAVNEIIVDGTRKSAANSYTFNNLNSNHTIVTSFKKAGASSYKTNLLKTDTRSYKMAPGNIYDARIQIDGSNFSQNDVKVYSSRSHIASVTKVTQDTYRIKGLSAGTTYITAEIGNTHASIRVDVAAGMKQGGESCRSVSIVESPIVYEDQYVKIEFSGIDEKSFLSRDEIVFFAENKTDYELTFQSGSLALNGQDLGHIGGSDSIAPKSKGKIRFNTEESISGLKPETISGTISVIDFSKSLFSPLISYDAKLVNVKIG